MIGGPIGWPIGGIIPTGGGPFTYDVTVSEAATATDAPSAVATLLASCSESASATDAPSAIGTFPASLSELGSASDAPSAAAVFAASNAESASATDSPVGLAVFTASLIELGSATDASTGAPVFGCSISESGSPGDICDASVKIALLSVDTDTYSKHPVNCVMAHDIVGVKKRISEWQVPKQEMKDSPRATKSPVNRLARYPAPSFTTRTGPANRID